MTRALLQRPRRVTTRTSPAKDGGRRSSPDISALLAERAALMGEMQQLCASVLPRAMSAISARPSPNASLLSSASPPRPLGGGAASTGPPQDASLLPHAPPPRPPAEVRQSGATAAIAAPEERPGGGVAPPGADTAGRSGGEGESSVVAAAAGGGTGTGGEGRVGPTRGAPPRVCPQRFRSAGERAALAARLRGGGGAGARAAMVVEEALRGASSAGGRVGGGAGGSEGFGGATAVQRRRASEVESRGEEDTGAAREGTSSEDADAAGEKTDVKTDEMDEMEKTDGFQVVTKPLTARDLAAFFTPRPRVTAAVSSAAAEEEADAPVQETGFQVVTKPVTASGLAAFFKPRPHLPVASSQTTPSSSEETSWSHPTGENEAVAFDAEAVASAGEASAGFMAGVTAAPAAESRNAGWEARVNFTQRRQEVALPAEEGGVIESGDVVERASRPCGGRDALEGGVEAGAPCARACEGGEATCTDADDAAEAGEKTDGFQVVTKPVTARDLASFFTPRPRVAAAAVSSSATEDDADADDKKTDAKTDKMETPDGFQVVTKPVTASGLAAISTLRSQGAGGGAHGSAVAPEDAAGRGGLVEVGAGVELGGKLGESAGGSEAAALQLKGELARIEAQVEACHSRINRVEERADEQDGRASGATHQLRRIQAALGRGMVTEAAATAAHDAAAAANKAAVEAKHTAHGVAALGAAAAAAKDTALAAARDCAAAAALAAVVAAAEAAAEAAGAGAGGAGGAADWGARVGGGRQEAETREVRMATRAGGEDLEQEQEGVFRATRGPTAVEGAGGDGAEGGGGMP
ncbi:hypothetical protein T484DRAFT_1874320, partial [Baffinella frigidus]